TVAGNVCWNLNLRKLWVLGSLPLIPDEDRLHDQLLMAAIQAFPQCQCLTFSNVPRDSFVWGYLTRSGLIRREFLTYLPSGWRRSDFLRLPATFGEYLAQFNKKKRYNLNRQVRLL